MTPIEIHAVLQRAWDGVASVHGELGHDISPDTAMALGETLGLIAKAKALVGRDIDASKFAASVIEHGPGYIHGFDPDDDKP